MKVEARWIRGITATSLVLLAAMIVGLSVVHGQATSVIARGGGQPSFTVELDRLGSSRSSRL